LTVLVPDAAMLAAETVEADAYGVAQLRADAHTLHFRFGRHQSDAEGFAVSEHELPLDQTASLSAFALAQACPVVVPNLLNFQHCQDLQLKRLGVGSAIVCPLIHVNQPFGSLGVYGMAPRDWPREDVLLVESIAHMLTTTIARANAERTLAEEKKFTASVIETMDALMLVLAPDGRILRMNRACRETTGFRPGEVKDRPIWSALLLPEDVSMVKGAFERLRRGEGEVEFECFILTKGGERRRLAWAFTTVRRDDGTIDSLVGTSVDITDKYVALEQLERSQATAEEAQRSVIELKERIVRGDIVSAGQESPDAFLQNPSGALPDGIAEERRSRNRRAFPYIQVVAPFDDGKLPERTLFREVRCRDISPTGFSYLTPVAPDYKRLVVAFGAPPALMYLAAEVVHVSPFVFNGCNVFVVGCRYMGRLS
jgi:PAS domain S-box-containing protein